MKLTAVQLRALQRVATWAGRGGTLMPFATEARSFEAAERKGFLEYRSVDQGHPLNGYALTPAGRALLSGDKPAALTPGDRDG